MSDEPFYVARARVQQIEGLHRRATLETGVGFDIGVHEPIRSHYRLDAGEDLPLPVDYIVAATGG